MRTWASVLFVPATAWPYQLYELEASNDELPQTDVVVVVGANDVVNPAARTTPSRPIYGMPMLNADAAKAVLVLKRGVRVGFAGIENELFSMPRRQMVFARCQGKADGDGRGARGGHG